MSALAEVLRRKFPDLVMSWQQDISDVVLEDIGEGQFVSKWNEKKLGPTPTKEQLAEWVAQDVPVPVLDDITRRQFFQALALINVITQSDAVAAMRGVIPASLQAFINNTLQDPADFDAEMFLIGATTFERTHPMVDVFANGLGWSAAQTNDLWSLAYTL